MPASCADNCAFSSSLNSNRAKCATILASIWQNSAPHHMNAKGLWDFSMFFVQYGFPILGSVAVAFVLCELFSPAWAEYRRRAVGSVVWLLNLVVVASLGAQF